MEEKKNKKFLGRVIYFVVLIILIAIVFKLFSIYRLYSFNEFSKIEQTPYLSTFSRDDKIKYTDNASYKIESTKSNDAMFYKTIKVEKFKPYKVTCMVKTQDVKTIKEHSMAGAHISIENTVEKSDSITGTNDWQKLEFIFNSKNRTSVNLGFRLGGYDDNCTGTAWFSDFTIEMGVQSTDTNWKFAFLVFEKTDVNIDGNNVKLNMNSTDISDLRQNMSRFKTSCEELSNGKMSAECDFITIDTPITSLTYDEENGYYIAPENVKDIIPKYIKGKNYDHIFIAVRLGDNIHQSEIPVNDWIGLGGMDYDGIGFSNIRLPNSSKSFIYKYDARVNTFPEEVFIHEFLHTLERNSEEFGYKVPKLHDSELYNYTNERLTGLKKWYSDYMTCNIKDLQGEKIGLNSDIYKFKPNKNEDFKFSYKLNEFKEPQNLIEEIRMLLNQIIDKLT